jgi:general secretion pathway protein F
MAKFRYRAVDRARQVSEGVLDAPTQDAALKQLQGQGMTPISLSADTANAAPLLQGGALNAPNRAQKAKPPGAEDVLRFTKELAVLLRSGLPLDRAIKVMVGMSANPSLAAVLQDILDNVKGGRGLSVALRNHQELFGNFYINMIRSGEASGQLSDVLTRLGDHLERAKSLRQSVTSALIYPSILLIVAVLSIALMLGFVVPQFKSLFADMGDRLPLMTQIVVAAGDGIAANGWIIILVAIPLWFLWQNWSKSPQGRATLDRAILRAPLVGTVALKYNTALFSRTMGTLLHNGVSLLESLGIASDTVGNSVLREALASLPPAIKQGGRLAAALDKTGVFPDSAIQMIAIGEESGRLDTMLLELANVNDDEVQASIKRALTLMEPLLILSLGAVIALIIISILMGILSVNELIA